MSMLPLQTRPLKTVDTWEQFLDAWRGRSTVPEAVGLLHYLIILLRSLSSEKALDRIVFLFNVLDETEENQVADVARQVLTSERVLADIQTLAREQGDRDDVAEVCMQVLRFFSTGHECLTRPPFPARIHTFISRAWTWWQSAASGHCVERFRGFGQPNETGGKWHPSFLDVAPYVRAAAIWGCADILTRPARPVSSLEVEREWIGEEEQARAIYPILEFVSVQVIVGGRSMDSPACYFKRFVRESLRDVHSGGNIVDLRNEDQCHWARCRLARTLLWCRLAAQDGEDNP